MSIYICQAALQLNLKKIHWDIPWKNMFGRGQPREKNPQGQRIEGWSQSFEKMLEDPIGLKAFTEFLKQEFSGENIMFWMACKNYAKHSDKTQIIKLAKEMYDLYLRPSAPEAVNINCHTRQLIRINLASAQKDLFSQAEKEVFTLMKFDCYQRFLKSDLYSQYLDAERLGRPFPGPSALKVSSPSPRCRFRSKSQDRSQHSKRSNSTNISISNHMSDLKLPVAEVGSSNRRSWVSNQKELNVLWNRLQHRLDDQRGTELNCDIPDFLLNDSISESQDSTPTID